MNLLKNLNRAFFKQLDSFHVPFNLERIAACDFFVKETFMETV